MALTPSRKRINAPNTSRKMTVYVKVRKSRFIEKDYSINTIWYPWC